MAAAAGSAGGSRIPGFVDLQINGWAGVDFSDPDMTPAAFDAACHTITASGTVAFLATLVTSPLSTYETVLPLIAAAIEGGKHPGLLGVHLEGPFISSEDGAVGCHRKEHVVPPSFHLLATLQHLARGHIKVVTIAACRPGAAELTRKATSELGIVVALGHQLASSQQLEELRQAGATLLTHLGNGMPNLVHRHRNAVIEGMASDLTASIITDGYHLPPDTIKAIVRAKGVAKTILVSDAAPVAGLPAGKHQCFGRPVLVVEGEQGFCVRDGERDNLAGSAATLLQCVNVLFRTGIASLADIEQVRDATRSHKAAWGALLVLSFYNPLALIGVSPARFEAEPAAVTFSPSTGFARN